MPKCVLIADDDEEIAELLTTALEMAGFAVAHVAHGGRLPAVVHKMRPDLLILDVQMPGLDGYSLQLQLSQEEATRNLPVIIVTALPAARPLFARFPQVKLFLEKPFDPGYLVEKVKEILQ